MDARRITTALAIPCALCVAGVAVGQDRLQAARDTRMNIVPSAQPDIRLPPMPEAEPRRASISSIESWSVDDDTEISVGRFRVVDRARQWGRMDRERAPLQMDVETRAIAGAGVRMRF